MYFLAITKGCHNHFTFDLISAFGAYASTLGSLTAAADLDVLSAGGLEILLSFNLGAALNLNVFAFLALTVIFFPELYLLPFLGSPMLICMM